MGWQERIVPRLASSLGLRALDYNGLSVVDGRLAAHGLGLPRLVGHEHERERHGDYGNPAHRQSHAECRSGVRPHSNSPLSNAVPTARDVAGP